MPSSFLHFLYKMSSLPNHRNNLTCLPTPLLLQNLTLGINVVNLLVFLLGGLGVAELTQLATDSPIVPWEICLTLFHMPSSHRQLASLPDSPFSLSLFIYFLALKMIALQLTLICAKSISFLMVCPFKVSCFWMLILLYKVQNCFVGFLQCAGSFTGIA